MNADITLHAKAQGVLQRRDGPFPAIRVTAVVGLRDAGDQVPDPALQGVRGGKRQENEVAPGYKGVRQTGRFISAARNLHVRVSQRIATQRGERIDRQAGVGHSSKLGNLRSTIEFYVMALSIVERHCINSTVVETIQRPVKTGRRVLATGKNTQRFFITSWHYSVFLLRFLKSKSSFFGSLNSISQSAVRSMDICNKFPAMILS